MRIAYVPKNFKGGALDIIEQANAICREYRAQGFDLTLRQLYYQFVARDIIPNRQSEYKRLGGIVNDARMAGLLDWEYIIDRTRELESRGHWESPAGVIRSAAASYARDLWSDQDTRVEVWIEKDALAGVIEPTCRNLDIAFFSCRGYTSQSEMWAAGQRLGRYVEAGQRVVILHLGDHDPSGLDMTRDITERIDTFLTQDYLNAHPEEFPGSKARIADIRKAMGARCKIDLDGYLGLSPAMELGGPFEVRRIALNMDQIEQYAPPPNPAKATDARFANYADLYGDESWELDSLDPPVLAALIRDEVETIYDGDRWDEALARENAERATVRAAADIWGEVAEFVEART